MPDALGPQMARQPFAAPAQAVVAADRQDNVHPAQGCQTFRVALAGQEVARVVKIYLLVMIAAGKATDVVNPTQPQYSVDLMWMSQSKIYRVIAAKTGADDDQERVLIDPLGERQ